MQILYSPQLNEGVEITYSFSGDIITASYKEVTDTFDFTGLPDGELNIDPLAGGGPIQTTLEVCPIQRCYKTNGVLYVELLKFIRADATDADKFPQWQEV